MSATGLLELRPYETIIVGEEADGQIVTVTLNRPEARNAISRRLAAELADLLLELGGRRELRVVIVTGAGDRAFCAGADLKERLSLSPDERIAHTAAIEAAAEALTALPMVTIAAVRGFALAGGTELAIACDLRVAASDAVFGLPEVKIGIFPGAGGVLRLPRLVGGGAARDLLFTGRQVTAEEAARLGLIDRLVAPEAVMAAARDMAGQIAANAPLAVRAVKRALGESLGREEAEARRIVNRHRATLDATADYQEGLAAFAERRAPRFRGE
jgi:enoyl-CoA hydratase/carnithine racemase